MKVLVAVEDDLFGDSLAEFIKNYEWPACTSFKVIHVLEPLNLRNLQNVSYMPMFELVEGEEQKRAAALVRRVALQLRDKFRTPYVEEEILHGRAKEKILEVAEEWGSDMIIVGSHGRRGVGLFMLGSVSNAIVSYAPCSVIVIKLPQAEAGEEQAQQSTEEAREVAV